MTAFEIEGIVSDKSRHKTLASYTNDCTKYNLAQEAGWKIYRFNVLHVGKERVNNTLAFIERMLA